MRPVGAAQRDAVKAKTARLPSYQECLVFVMAKDGKVFTAIQPAAYLGTDFILSGEHKDLPWWPFSH